MCRRSNVSSVSFLRDSFARSSSSSSSRVFGLSHMLVNVNITRIFSSQRLICLHHRPSTRVDEPSARLLLAHRAFARFVAPRTASRTAPSASSLDARARAVAAHSFTISRASVSSYDATTRRRDVRRAAAATRRVEGSIDWLIAACDDSNASSHGARIANRENSRRKRGRDADRGASTARDARLERAKDERRRG